MFCSRISHRKGRGARASTHASTHAARDDRSPCLTRFDARLDKSRTMDTLNDDTVTQATHIWDDALTACSASRALSILNDCDCALFTGTVPNDGVFATARPVRGWRQQRESLRACAVSGAAAVMIVCLHLSVLVLVLVWSSGCYDCVSPSLCACACACVGVGLTRCATRWRVAAAARCVLTQLWVRCTRRQARKRV
jgi:hypothetical protein